uniref:Peptidase_M13_N domain-containing protein n=1 Tax=Steinernema glaseri TaxID=37863 RepID=A0A1I7ZAI8_9BILA
MTRTQITLSKFLQQHVLWDVNIHYMIRRVMNGIFGSDPSYYAAIAKNPVTYKNRGAFDTINVLTTLVRDEVCGALYKSYFPRA